ncbi:DUF1802 family protein [Paenibacillus methanolicus]|uniref:DUF1802 family protein n=1 Tax=Paenibacillus methanolicus TaxID=582686 RepID=A0A5S5BVZ4_9BACL|nr:DUF1802 family protein [Paenibacillus methanolicus]TYP71207.1 hypothetical protein BCM02_110157 [Paenibacillus methanolicus]
MNGGQHNRPAALRDWAVAVKALTEGKQILVLRKGGIAEETRDFRLVSDSFYLLPAYEHQKPELLKEAYRQGIEETLADWNPEKGTVRVGAYAEAVEDIELRDQETLDRIREFHIWTDAFAEERLKWKRSKPLHLLLLRVYAAEEPVEIPMLPSYSGCKSWVSLEEESLGLRPDWKPVLDDETFGREREAVLGALGL